MECWINGKREDVTRFGSMESLPQYVVLSLFSWRRAADGDGYAPPDLKGWWGDSFDLSANGRIGSRLWELEREKVTRDTAGRSESYALEALRWLTDDGIAGEITAKAEIENSRINLLVTVYKPDGDKAVTAKFTNLWS